MRILLIGPDSTNATDGCIVDGIFWLIRNVYTDHQVRYIMLDDHKPQAFDKLENYDKIVVCGTPWLWDQFQKSHKYLNLLSLFKRYENTPKIFMGAGSCITLAQTLNTIEEGLQTPKTRPSSVEPSPFTSWLWVVVLIFTLFLLFS